MSLLGDEKENTHENLPIPLAPDQDDEERDALVFRPTRPSKDKGDAPHAHSAASQETKIDSRPAGAMSAPLSPSQPLSHSKGEPMSEALRWALDAMHAPAMAAADWLARDIDPTQPTAAALLANPNITLAQVRQAKAVFKTMRIVGEKSADRRVGGRMYAAAIAAGLVRHGKKITTQSDAALKRGFNGLLDDRRMPQELRDLAGMALCMLDDITLGRNTHPDHHSKSA
jgi:hypothetical protein